MQELLRQHEENTRELQRLKQEVEAMSIVLLRIAPYDAIPPAPETPEYIRKV